jgi:hypothetical protein
MNFVPMAMVVAGQLLAPALACGINLYATVAALGIASRVGLLDALPIGLRGLEHPLVIGTALALYLVEFAVDKVPRLDSLWDAVHTVVRPAAAALLAALAFEGATPAVQAGAAAAAFTAALAAHAMKAGLRIAMRPERRWLRAALSVVEDMLAVGLAVLALHDPVMAGAAAAVALLLLAAAGPRLWRAFVLGGRALAARLRGFFGTAAYRELPALPDALRSLAPAHALGAAPPRALRAALSGRGAGSFRNGWLVLSGQGPSFLYRTLLGPRRVDLSGVAVLEVRSGHWTDRVHLASTHGRFTLYLLKDGPPSDMTIAELKSPT